MLFNDSSNESGNSSYRKPGIFLPTVYQWLRYTTRGKSLSVFEVPGLHSWNCLKLDTNSRREIQLLWLLNSVVQPKAFSRLQISWSNFCGLVQITNLPWKHVFIWKINNSLPICNFWILVLSEIQVNTTKMLKTINEFKFSVYQTENILFFPSSL